MLHIGSVEEYKCVNHKYTLTLELFIVNMSNNIINMLMGYGYVTNDEGLILDMYMWYD